jgi:hypothetical protein
MGSDSIDPVQSEKSIESDPIDPCFSALRSLGLWATLGTIDNEINGGE